MAVSPVVVITIAMAVTLLAVAGWLSRTIDFSLAGGGGGSYESNREHASKPGGVTRWLTTVDHKDIGILYAVYGLVAFAWGGVAVLLMRTELLTPNLDVLPSTSFYNGLMTTHGITMLFLFGTPMIAAFGNYVVPMLVDADDMAFPRINAIAFWILPFATLLIWAGFFLPLLGLKGGPAATGWYMYAPLSVTQQNFGDTIFFLGLHLSGVATTMSAVNFIATIVAERDSASVPWSNLDIFSWTMLTQSFLVLFSFPLLGAVLLMLVLDRTVGTTFFLPNGGGGPLLFQHLFWFFGHPEVYILVLPPMGLVSLILPKFAGRKLFGFKFIVYSTLAIGVLSWGVWGHHMFTTGIDPRIRGSFMAISLAIALPSSVKIFNWIATLWNGKLRMTAPMLFVVGAVQNFIIGGVTGVFLAAIPFDMIMNSTYYVVGHFHFIVYGMIGFALFAAFYYYFPMMTGRMYNRRLARWHFWLSIVGGNVTFFAMLVLGYGGMPRRYATYLPRFTAWHDIATFGAYLIGLGTVIFAWNAWQSWRAGQPIEDADPWNLKESGQFTPEWQWFERERGTALTDGGESADETTEDDDE